MPTHSSSSYHHHYSTNNQDDEQTNETSSSPSLSNSPLTTTTTNTTPTITNINAKKSTVSQQHLNNHNRLLENQNIINSFDYKEQQQQQQQQQNINLSHQNQQLQQQVLANNFSNLKIATSLANSCKAMDDFSSTQSQRKIGSIADYDPLNYEKRGMGPMPNSISSNTLPDSYASLQQQQQQQQQQKNQQAYYAANSNANNFNFNDIQTSVFKAIYDYDAKEDDEISFRDGDKFTNCEQIDVGWMIGIHYSTGKHGMFPSNYVEPVDLF